MARKSTRKPQPPRKAPNDGTPLGHLSDADLLTELARRRARSQPLDLESMESAVEDSKHAFGVESFATLVASLPPETDAPKPCPKCGRLVPVKARSRPRTVLTLSGEVTFHRHYHHCDSCSLGFSPRDAQLKLPEDGDLSPELERRILDFGVNDTFASAAERFSVHYSHSISENLVRLVIERVGKWCEEAAPLQVQKACRPMTAEPAGWLTVAPDGSMVCTRDSAWKEAKVAVVARGDSMSNAARTGPLVARYVAVVGGRDAFAEQLRAALEAERADEVTKVAWVGDGAPLNWTLADELCPLAVQVLDLPHAIGHGIDCAKVLLEEQSPLLPLWKTRIHQLLEAGPDALIHELMECVSETETEEQLGALDELVRYYRANERRMRYAEFRQMGLPIGSGIVESAHKHVLQVRMKRAGQRWSLDRADRMAKLRAAYRTSGPARFHWAIRKAAQRSRRSS